MQKTRMPFYWFFRFWWFVWAMFSCVGEKAQAADLESGLFPPVMDRLYENRLMAESAEYLSLNLFDVPVDPARVKELSAFVIVSRDDPEYAAAKRVHPIAAGSRTRAARVAVRKNLLVQGTCIFLKLPRPMKNGRAYRVIVENPALKLPALAPVRFDDRRQISDNLRVNQLGYLPGYAKRAYLGQYLGDLGGMPFASLTFHLWDRQGKTVFTGAVRRRGVNDDLVGQIVYELDFTAFRGEERYRIQVPGVGVSYPFEIGPRALNPAFVNLMRGNYHQRCGVAVDPGFSRHHRAACHLDDAFLDAAAEKLPFVQPKQPPLYLTGYTGARQAATRGHHDAGDYGKYTTTGAGYVFSILNALDAFPDRFRNDNLGLPGSGNGIPDLVEECKWELDWLERMQDGADGGVFGVIRPRSGSYEHFLPPKASRRFFFPKDTVFTAAYAAALAHASRSPLLRKHYPADSARYLARARKAWEFLEKNQRYVEYFHYGSVFGDWDERCWAAVELYAATGEDRFHRYFRENFDPAKKRWDWSPRFEAVGYAADAYLFLKGRARDPQMLARCKQALREACAMHLSDAAAFPYRLSLPQPTIRHGDYGWVFPGDLAGYDLLIGYAALGRRDARYLQCALDNLGYTFGANPSGYFLQTGMGAKRNIEAVSDHSSWDEIIEPIPGLPLGIGSGKTYRLHTYGSRVNEGAYPEQWPLMNRWYDGFNVQTEFTMTPMIRETLTAAFFSDLGDASQKAVRPRVRIQTVQAPDPAGGSKVRFTIVVSPASAAIGQVFWDFDDETFSIQQAPTHVFKDAGRTYTVAVTILDKDGFTAYDTQAIHCPLPNPPYPRQEWKTDAKTLLLLHFNGSLKDASGNGLPVTVSAKRSVERRGFTFSDSPSWMARPQGGSACLSLDGAEQLSVTIPPNLLPDPATVPLMLEMLLYLRAFAGYEYPGDPLVFGLQNDWDSALGWRQETWGQAGAPRFGTSQIPAARFAEEFPRNRWCHVQIVYDGQKQARFFVDGALWGVTATPPFKPGLKTPTTLTIGPFRGLLDEVRLRTLASEPALTEKPPGRLTAP